MMAFIREMNISSIGEPAHVKIEKNSKGYNYEISLHGEYLDSVIDELFKARTRLEKELTQQVTA